MTDGNKAPRTPKAESLEAKFKLLARLPYDRRVGRKHCLVFAFILDWHHSRYGDALASVRHVATILKERDPAEAGLGLRHIHEALADLVSWGYLTQEKGVGRRASRYVPTWDLLSVSTVGNTSEDELCVSPVGNTGVSPVGNTTAICVPHGGNEDPSTLIRSTDPDTGKDEVDCPTPLAGLTAATAVQGGFEELYRTYGVRKNKTDARRAYEKLAPDADLHARMMVAACAWRAAGDGVERMHLRRWIEEERYDEDPKGERRLAERPAKTEKRNPPEPANDDIPPFMIGSPRLWPKGRHVGEFVEGHVDTESGDHEVTLAFRVNGGEVFKHRFFSQAYIKSYQEEGQRILSDITHAVGLDGVSDTDDLLFRPLVAVADGDTIQYLPLEISEAA